MFRKKIIVPLSVLAITGTAIFGVSMANAQTNGTNPMSGLVQAIAQKFNLNQADVQSVFDTYKNQHKADMQQKMQQMEDQRLSDLVTQGKITAAQKTAIETELTQLKSKYNIGAVDQNLTMEQRRQNMQNFQNDWQTWAKSQGIDPTILRMGPGMRMGRRGYGFGKWSASPTPTTAPSAT